MTDMTRPWTTEELDLHEKLWADLTLDGPAAARMLGRSMKAFRAKARERGFPHRDRKGKTSEFWTDEKWETARDRFIAGDSAAMIAEDIGISRSAVCGKLNRMGVVRGPSDRRIPMRAPPKLREVRPRVARAPKPDKPKRPRHRFARSVAKPQVQTPAERALSKSVLNPYKLPANLWEPLEGSEPREFPAPRGHCDWPLDGPLGRGVARCCLPAKSRYCETHHSIAYGGRT